MERRRIGKPVNSRRLQRGDEQAEPRDRHRVRVEVHAGHRIKRALRELAHVHRRLVLLPFVEQAVEGAEQEMAGTACRIDQPHLGEPELRDRRRQRAIEDELLDELRRLQQRVLLPSGLGQVLVEIAEKARVQRRIGEVVRQCTSGGIDSLPELDEQGRAIA